MNALLAIFALWGAVVAQDEEDSSDKDLFRIEYYSGLRQNAVVKIHYKKRISGWPRQPHYCYGALIDFTIAIVPCSCVAYRNDGEMASAWHQASHSDKVDPIASNSITIGLMGDEHSQRERTNQVKVDKIVLHAKCDATFQVDYALLVLKSKPKRARLAWVNSPEADELKKQLRGVFVESTTYGKCIVLRWSVYTGSIEETAVNFQMWSMCERLVCPKKTPVGEDYEPANFRQCFNEDVSGQRACLTMIPEATPLCNSVPGSPVFCEVGQFHGIVGMMTNFTTNCNSINEGNNAIMESFEDAMDLAHPHLRVRASTYFSNLRVYLKD